LVELDAACLSFTSLAGNIPVTELWYGGGDDDGDGGGDNDDVMVMS
jgi:hypothetical protein